MKAILVKPYGQAEVIELKNELQEYNDLVGGYIENVYYKDFILVVNEEGRIRRLDLNVFDLVGNIVIVRNGVSDYAGLTDSDIEMWLKLIKEELEKC